jgi:hypothetical protein
MKVIIGSWALNHAGINFRKAKDYDIWISEDEDKSKLANADFHIAPIEIIELIPVIPNTNVATVNAIYTIKCSHMGWDIKWEKHKSDVIWLKANGCELIPDLYKKLVKYWETVHGDKNHLSLNKTKEEFFDDHVIHVYNHDLLHEIVAKPNRPIYESVLKDDRQVLIDKRRFLLLGRDYQIKLFREEIKVIALERFLIPAHFKMSVLKAYLLALKKTITNLTKNWATEFIVENLYEFSHMGNINWYNNFKKYIGENKMNNPEVIEKIKNKAEELGISDGVIESVLVNGDHWYFTKEGINECGEEFKKFGDFLTELKFNHLHQEGGGEGGTEYCESVIELEGQAYKLSYSYFSFRGYDIDDIWDWKPVVAKQKTVTYYE